MCGGFDTVIFPSVNRPLDVTDNIENYIVCSPIKIVCHKKKQIILENVENVAG